MILPPNVSSCGAYMDPFAMSSDHRLSYLLSYDNNNVSQKTIHYSPKDIYSSPLESFNFVNFSGDAYQKLLNQTEIQLTNKTHGIAKSIRNGFKEYFLRVANKTLNACMSYQNFDFMAQYDQVLGKNQFLQNLNNDYKIESMKGSIPSKWPEGLKDFLHELKKIPIIAFYNEAQPILEEFISNIMKAIQHLLRFEKKPDFIDSLFLQLQALIGVVLRTGNYTQILSTLDFLLTIQKKLTAQQGSKLAPKLSKHISELMAQVDQIQKQPKLQYQHSACDVGAFEIMEKCHFQRFPFYHNTLATDGQYLYLYVSSTNGGMFKIGTGQNSVAGKIYLHQPINTGKADQVSWVYLKGKLYLRSSSKQPKNLDIIDPQTFKTQGSIQLHCPPIFGHVSMQNINKNYPLLTDGQNLYFIGKRLTIQKLEQKKEQKQKQEQLAQAPITIEPQNEKQRRRKERAQRKKKKGTQQNILKLLEYVLYEFDVTNAESKDHTQQPFDKQLTNELYESFNGYFTHNQCCRALNLHKQDIASASQWLVDEGEKQRTKRTYTVSKSVVLGQVQVTNDAHTKALRNYADILVKQDSILQVYQISDCIWTCSKQQVACYTQQGIKIFSKNQADFKNIHTRKQPQQTKQPKDNKQMKQKDHKESHKQQKQQRQNQKKYKLKGTYIQTVEVHNRKFTKQPEYLIIYDNIHKKYYTFHWTDYQHAFPSTVTISRDYLQYEAQIVRQRPQNLLNIRQVNTISDLVDSLLYRLSLMQQIKLRLPWKPNNWLYIYSGMIMDLNNKIKASKDDGDAKKKLSSKRAKIITKMNKVCELTNYYKKQRSLLKQFKTSVRQIKPQYAYTMNGRIETLKLIQKILNRPQRQDLYFYILELWVANAEVLLISEKEYISEFGNKLFNKLKTMSTGDSYDNLLRVLIKGFYIFFTEQKSQFQFILHLNKIQLSDLVITHFSQYSTKLGLRQSYIQQLSDDQILNKYDFSSNFQNIFQKKNYLDLTHQKQSSNIGWLLIDAPVVQNQKTFEKTRIIQCNRKAPQVDEQVKKLRSLFLEKIAKGLQQGNQQVLSLYKAIIFRAIDLSDYNFETIDKLTIQVLGIIQQSLPKMNLKNQSGILKLLSFIVSIYYSLPCVFSPANQVQHKLINIIQSMLRPEIIPILNSIHLYKLEGISQTLEKTFETNHPYERGKTQNFETQNFMNAIFVTAQFDKRCQSDPNHDFLSIYASYQSLSGQIQQRDNNNNDKFNTHLKISGKIHSRTPYLLLGSSISMDFMSSGHAKDEHSLNRFGFKFGLRPAYSGKIQYTKADLQEVVLKFGNKNLFQQYVYVLKLLVVVSGAMAENMLIENDITNQQSLSQYLGGKIFKQGLQEPILQTKTKKQRQQLVNTFLSKQHKDKFNAIAKDIYLDNYENVKQQIKQEKIVEETQESFWNLNGIPQYLKKQIEQIKMLKGNFINLFLEAKSQVKNTGSYAIQSKRKAFTEEYKNLWLKGQALLFLTVLKHSGLLQVSLKFSIEYIKQNLQAFEQARNSVFNSFIFRMQLEKEWQDLLQTYHNPPEQQQEEQIVDNKQKQKTEVKDKKSNVTFKKTGKKIAVKIQAQKKEQAPKQSGEKKKKKVVINPEVIIRQRMTDSFQVGQMCKYKKIPFVQDQTYSNVTQIINKIKLQKPSNKSIYQAPAFNLIKSCLFLLKLRSPNNTVQNPNTEQLKPLGVYRSFSQGVDQKKINKDKVVVFRQWLQNWKKWKGFKKQQKVELRFPVRQIVQFITGWVDIKQMQDVMNERYRLISRRVDMINLTTNVTKIVSNTFFEKYILGIVSANLKDGALSDTNGTPQELRKSLQSAVAEHQSCLQSIYSQQQKKLPTLSKFQSQLKHGSIVIPKIKSVAMNNLLLCCDMINPDLTMALFYMSFKMVSNYNQELIQLSNKIVCKALLSHPSVTHLIQSLWRQVGKDTLSMRRWKDPIFIERLLFLLLKTQTLVKKSTITYQQKLSLAQPLFYIAYHIESPLVNKITLRIIKQLDISQRTTIPTPFNVKYIQFKDIANGKNTIKFQTSLFELQQNKDLTNWQLLTQRAAQNTFRKSEPILQTLLQSKKTDKKYHLLLNLSNQEDIAWIVRILFYLEEFYPTAKKIQSWESYIAEKNKKQQNKNNKKDPLPPVIQTRSQGKIIQKIITNCPNQTILMEKQIQDQLPIGWYLTYSNCFSKYQIPKQNWKKVPSNNIPKSLKQRKNWQCTVLNTLLKKFQELNNKPLQQPKQADSKQDKVQFIAAKNFIIKMRKLSLDVQLLMAKLMNFGYVVFAENMPKDKINFICELFELGKNNRLQPIKVQLTKKDYKTRLTPNEPNAPAKTELSLSIIDSSFESTFEYLIDYNSQYSGKDNSLPQINRNQVVLEDNQHMNWTELLQIDQASTPYMKLGKALVQTGWFQQKRQINQVQMVDYDDSSCTIVQGGIQSGIKKTSIISNNDSALTTQQVDLDNIKSSIPVFIPDDQEQLLEELKTKTTLNKIQNIEDIIPFMQIKMLLQKAEKIDWSGYDSEDLKQFTSKLLTLSKNKINSKKTVKQYEQQLSVLMSKLFDSNIDSLDIVQFYDVNSKHDPRLDKFIVQVAPKKDVLELHQKGETSENYFLQNSPFIRSVDNQPPPVEENKLLKYWEKNIIPRILEFVKTTLKQLQIDQFFEQMRIPLRKNDQNQAAKIAYVICDNKLPPGAVLPDANHDWSTLSIQQVQISQYVLLKLPKSINQSSTPLLQSKSAEDLCIVQIVFIDSKNNNLLVRHRISQFSIIHYFWVSITSVLPVQAPVKYMSLQEVFINIQQCLNGLICGYAKQVLTKLSSFVQIDTIELVKQNILDMFVNDPIEGWLHNTNEWSIQHIIQKMLSQNNNKLVDYISTNLVQFKSYESNLFTNQLKPLSVFNNNTSLVVSFQKKTKLSLCAGVRFYSDQMAINQIQHIYSGNKIQKNYFEPLIFKHPKVFAKYYNNLENLGAQDQGNVGGIDIPVMVFGVQPIWTIAGFLGDKISEIGLKESKYQDQIKKIIKSFVDWILKQGSYVLKSIASQLVTRMVKRLIQIYQQQGKQISLQNLGVTQSEIQKIITAVKQMQQSQSKDVVVILYEDYLQNMVQMLGNFLCNIKINFEIPEFIQSVIDSMNLNKFIRGEPCKPPVIDSDMNAQWQRFLFVQKLPPTLPGQQIRRKVIDIIAQNKGRILTPYLDVHYQNNSLIALVDGWDIVDLVQQEVIQKIEEQQQKQPEQQQGNFMMWICNVCTFQNGAGNTNCEMCQSPAPVPQTKQVFQKIQQVDLNQAANKLKQKESKRFTIVKQTIKQFIDNYWKQQIQKVNKQNKQIQQKNKIKQQQRKKKEQRQMKRKKDKKEVKINKQEEILPLKQVPEIIECQIITGSEVLKHSIIERFLERRLVPCETNKFIIDIVGNSTETNLEKFKLLEKKGIDLWGVKMIDQKATLLPYELLVQLMRYVQTDICKQTSSVLSYNPNSIRLITQCNNLSQSDKQMPINFRVESDTGTIIKYSRLAECKPCDIRFSWFIIKSYNNCLSQTLPFIRFDLCKSSELQKHYIQKLPVDTPLGEMICSIRQLIMCSIKSQLLQKVMQKTSISRDQVPKIIIQRLKIKEGERTAILSSKQKDQYILSKAYEQVKTISSTQFRPFKPKGAQPYLAFQITFKGQNVQGQGGPYRQFFTDISNQLHPSRKMGLLIPTPNNLHQMGEARSKYITNPKATNSYQLGLFQFIGMLMGCSIRTGAHLALDLPAMVWKQLVGQSVLPSDFIQVDLKFYEMTKQILECPSQQEFQQIDEISGQPLYWVATLSDGSQIQLIKNGASTKVLYKQRHKFVNKLLETRFKQSILQIKSMRKGLATLIPEPLLNCFSGEDIQIYVCGRPKVDVLLLKRHTKYSGQFVQDSPLIKMFWNVLLQMTEPERLKFIKFCWGQQRLPINSEQFQRNNIRFMIKPQLMNVSNPDYALPRADTCFFNIQLPKYSTKQIMRQRIIIAINTDSDSMNAQQQREDNPLMHAGDNSSYDGDGDNY